MLVSVFLGATYVTLPYNMDMDAIRYPSLTLMSRVDNVANHPLCYTRCKYSSIMFTYLDRIQQGWKILLVPSSCIIFSFFVYIAGQVNIWSGRILVWVISIMFNTEMVTGHL